jgi:GrpB-like predicted nucleotidyltransferase (UPF0157 family)
MGAKQQRSGESELVRHPSLDDRFDPAVRIVDYDRAWPARAEAELDRIAKALSGLVVRREHVGSTAVPGLGAKPIIDLQVSMHPIEPRDDYAKPLEQLGYLFVSAPESPRYHLFAKPPMRPRAYHLHVCEGGSDEEFRHIALRDYLRSHPDEAALYEQVKRRVVARHPEDRLAYIEGKSDYVAELQARATAWARVAE